MVTEIGRERLRGVPDLPLWPDFIGIRSSADPVPTNLFVADRPIFPTDIERGS